MSILRLEQVCKSYNQHHAVDEVSFEIPTGSIFGMLGPNGAGKTSLIRIITTIIRADSGTVFFNGEKLSHKHPALIGYMPEERGLYRKMRVGEHLLYLARLKGLPKRKARAALQEWMDHFGILDWWGKKIEELSKGMQQKIQFIATVVHRPPLLILDEPFSGLDPINTNLIKDEIDKMAREGTSIIFSTHRMEQVEEVCQHIVLINQGRNVLEGPVDEVKHRFKENRFRIQFLGILPSDLEERISIIERGAQSITVQLDGTQDSNSLLRYLLDHQIQVLAFHEILPSLNEIFIKQIGAFDAASQNS
ncbi:MAG: ATP-binding cassette domain-containing protein [Bacteroidota bacterium]